MSSKQLPLEQALHCAKCTERAQWVEEHSGTDFSTGEIVLISCPSTHCRERPWFYCRSCRTKCYLNGLNRHALSKRHVEQHAIKYGPPAAPPIPTKPPTHDAAVPFPGEEATNEDAMEIVNDEFGHDTADLQEAIENNLALTHVENGESTMEVCTTEATEGKNQFQPISCDGCEWLAELMKDTPMATKQEMHAAFDSPGLLHMKNFWMAELGSGRGYCGGGLVILVARAFQQVKEAQVAHIGEQRFPTFEEAKWHFDYLLQYHSMNEKQRHRESRLNKAVMKFLPPDMFFKNTFLPLYSQLGRYYGNTGQHSMWNNLPCPIAEDVDGVAYVSPKAIISFLMANGIAIDDFVVTPNTAAFAEDAHLRRVHSVSECHKSVEWIQEIQRNYFGSKNGAPDLNFGASPFVVLLPISDWTDGFDSARVKSNRNAIDSKTMTISPPKCLINGTENTFAVALGLKKAKAGWRKVEARFREELESLTRSCKPIMFFHGGLQKMVPCFLRRYAVLSDKAERNGLTGTLGCGSDIHKCYGVTGRIQTPGCDIVGIKRLL